MLRLDQAVECFVFGEPMYGIYIRECFGNRSLKEPVYANTRSANARIRNRQFGARARDRSNDRRQ
jgi:hypothetical protein